LARRLVTEQNAVAGLELADIDFDFVEMRMAIGSGVDACDFHGMFLEKAGAKSKLDNKNGFALRGNIFYEVITREKLFIRHPRESGGPGFS
jgi:hypothetical protein